MLMNIETPIYKQLFQQLQASIETGTYTFGQCLPSERDLASWHGISRDTVRKAVDLLEEYGYISREHGKGNIVIKKVTD